MIVARHGHVGYFRSFGLLDRERDRAVPDDAIWRIYSMTKPITGVALMSLYERGMFQLSDPVARFIPSWANLKVREVAADGTKTLVEPRRPMNMRDAMMHMTGLGWGGRRTPFATATSPLSEAADTTLASALANPLDGDWTLETLVERLAERPLRFHPGTQWFYSVSTDVCARLVEIISGRRFDDYLNEHIFEPLRMVDTGFTVPDEKVDRFAANYGRARDKSLRLIEDPLESGYRKPRTFLSGGGGLVSTSADYVRFAQMMCNGGELDGTRILSRKTDGADDAEPPSRWRAAARLRRTRRLRRSRVRRRGLRADDGGRARTGREPDGRHRRRVHVGRRGFDHVLGRPDRGDRRDLHDAVDAVRHLQLPRPVEDARLRRHRRLIGFGAA